MKKKIIVGKDQKKLDSFFIKALVPEVQADEKSIEQNDSLSIEDPVGHQNPPILNQNELREEGPFLREEGLSLGPVHQDEEQKVQLELSDN